MLHDFHRVKSDNGPQIYSNQRPTPYKVYGLLYQILYNYTLKKVNIKWKNVE